MFIKSVPNYPHIVATSEGTIYNIITGNRLEGWLDKNGYRIVDISGSSVPVHRLVCMTYHGESLLTVNHKDGNKKNNHFTNLEWISRGDNIQHALDIGLSKKRPIRAMRIGTDYIVEYGSVADCARDLKIDKSAITHCLQGKYKQWKGYRFEDL